MMNTNGRDGDLEQVFWKTRILEDRSLEDMIVENGRPPLGGALWL